MVIIKAKNVCITLLIFFLIVAGLIYIFNPFHKQLTVLTELNCQNSSISKPLQDLKVENNYHPITNILENLKNKNGKNLLTITEKHPIKPIIKPNILPINNKTHNTNNRSNNTIHIIYVSKTGDNINQGLTPETSKKTIQNALDTLSNGGIVYVAEGIYNENIKIKKNVTLKGSGSGYTIISGNQKTTCIEINKNFKVLIQGFTIINGYSWSYRCGGGITNSGILNLENCIIAGNRAIYGSGCYNTGELIINNVIVNNNVATRCGGGFYNEGQLTVNNSQIKDNEGYERGGGGFYNSGNLNVYNSTIENNIAHHGSVMFITHSGGGGFYNSGNLNIISSNITNNLARRCDGGGIYNKGSLTMRESLISANKALQTKGYNSYGGGIYNNGKLTLILCNILNNKAKTSGGGIYNNHKAIKVNKTNINGNKPDNIPEEKNIPTYITTIH